MRSAGNSLRAAPIAVFAYNRPDKLVALLDSLKVCQGFEQSQVTVFVDGPKREEDQAAVAAVQSVVRRASAPNIAWSFGEVNRGLRESISAGVSQMVHTHGRVIVLEDDLILSPAALTYFNAALDHYENADRVWSIVGYAYDVPSLRNSSETVALPFTHPWGWATWGRSWQHFSLDNRPDPDTLESQAFKSAFDMNGLYPFTDQLRSSLRGRVNSWYIHWYYTVFKHGAVSIFPPRRLVDNYGLGHGTHGSAMNPHERLVKRPPLLDVVPTFCSPDDVDYGALDLLKRCRELRVQRFIAEAGSAKRRVKALSGAASGG